MRTRPTHVLVASAVAALLAAGLTGCGDDDDAATTTSEEAGDGAATTDESDTTADVTTSTAAPPADEDCEEGAVRDAIDASDGVSPGLAYEITYLACEDGYGWATISAEGLDSATVLLRVSGDGSEVLNLGTSVCATDAGIPPDIAAAIAPPGHDPLGDCP